MNELTRRQLGLAALGAAVLPVAVLPVAAQTTANPFADAVESKRKAAAELATVALPMATEPAFEFKP